MDTTIAAGIMGLAGALIGGFWSSHGAQKAANNQIQLSLAVEKKRNVDRKKDVLYALKHEIIHNIEELRSNNHWLVENDVWETLKSEIIIFYSYDRTLISKSIDFYREINGLLTSTIISMPDERNEFLIEEGTRIYQHIDALVRDLDTEIN